jgi:S-adenosylmethionine uptake transporter
MTQNAKGAFFALIAMGIFATHDVVVKWLGEAGFSAFQTIFFASLFSFPLVSLILLGDAKEGSLRPKHPVWMVVRTLMTSATGLAAFYAFSVLPLAQTYAILFATPLIITILAIPLLGENVGFRRWAAVIVGLCGVLVVLRPGATEFSLGHLAALVAAFCGALAAVIVRKVGKEERSVVMILYPIMGNFILMGAAIPFVYEPPEVEHVGGLLVIALFGLIASYFVIQAYRIGEAAVVAPMQYSQIIWASIYGYLLFDEHLDIWTIVGTLIIIMSGVYIVIREGQTGASETTPVFRTRMRTETVTSPRPSLLYRVLHPRLSK